MCPMFVTECFHNKCFKLSTLCSVYISPGCESDMILSVMTIALDKIIHDIICDYDHVQYIYLDMHTDLEL